MFPAQSLLKENTYHVTSQKRWDVVEQQSEDGGTTDEPNSARHLSTVDVGEMETILGQKDNANSAANEPVVVRHFL